MDRTLKMWCGFASPVIWSKRHVSCQHAVVKLTRELPVHRFTTTATAPVVPCGAEGIRQCNDAQRSIGPPNSLSELVLCSFVKSPARSTCLRPRIKAGRHLYREVIPPFEWLHLNMSYQHHNGRVPFYKYWLGIGRRRRCVFASMQ